MELVKSRRGDIDNFKEISCGADAAKHFNFSSGYKNLNHGSFGTYPLEVRSVMRSFQDECEQEPDNFLRYKLPNYMDESREAISKHINAPTETVVLIPNATTGVNIVLRNLVFSPGDVIIYCSTIYGACHKTVEYIVETTPAESHQVEFHYPISDDDVVKAYESAFKKIRSEGKTPKIAIFDTLVSMPGVRMPFEHLTELCRSNNVLSLVDGAHSVGQLPLNLSKLDPDFFVSNAHKWLLVPRGCAVFYVPVRHQHLIRSSLPTSHGFIPKTGGKINNPLPPSTKSEFVNAFEFVGTVDWSPYFCIPAAIAWRSKITYGEKTGEDAILDYCCQLSAEGGKLVASALGTELLENEKGTLSAGTNFVNVRLPISYSDDAGGNYGNAAKIGQWMTKQLLDEHNTFMVFLLHDDKIYTRISSAVYLTLEDYELAAKALVKLCERVRQGAWK
ncbi:related to isopenicillin N epimerase [Ramularia collo-cygni]|uniref:Related to isopenicillin N epimerase n=1 Tax=Ramularia collo-cygni TaxID=112498 RepID=A0A2D3UWY7_9PEZI|nr:related to isopenicillin N epimerase [Ramularia collo-cygni]CZT19918.1 related to isopenicillin N epimerase [Ramularia collo-cygni]